MKVRMIVISAPSGAGKSSFIERITQDFPRLRDTVTYTTRAMRAGETEGHPYHFVSEERFSELKAKAFFVEWALVHGHYYGTPIDQLESAWAVDEVIIMDVDVQGATTFKRKFPDAVSIFILPPSIDELRRRILKRDQAIPDNLQARLQNAEDEIKRADEFDYKIFNDDFSQSYQQFKKLIAELLACG